MIGGGDDDRLSSKNRTRRMNFGVAAIVRTAVKARSCSIKSLLVRVSV